jgi:hypothetical protein
MIFVSMTSDELLARTAQYQIQYASHRSRSRRIRRSGAQASREYLNAFRSPLRSLDRIQPADFEFYSDSEMESNATVRGEAPNYPTLMSDNSISEFRITTNFEDKSEDEEDGEGNEDDFPSTTEIERMDLEHLEEDMLCPEDDGSESDDDTNETSAINRGRLERRRQVRMAHRQNNFDDHELLPRRYVPNLVQPISSTSQDNSGFTIGSSQSPEVLKPHARFSIEREKTMVNIKFDPPPYAKLNFLTYIMNY